jgi:anti-sigma factor RsiW
MGRGDDTRAATRLETSVSEEELNAYVDGELPPARRRSVERLIARDENVRARVEALQRLSELVRSALSPTIRRRTRHG